MPVVPAPAAPAPAPAPAPAAAAPAPVPGPAPAPAHVPERPAAPAPAPERPADCCEPGCDCCGPESPGGQPGPMQNLPLLPGPGNVLHPLPLPLPETNPGGNVLHPLPLPLPETNPGVPGDQGRNPGWPGIDPGFWINPPAFEPLPGELPRGEAVMPWPGNADIKPMPLPEVIPFEPAPDSAPGGFPGTGVTPDPLPLPREINGVPVAEAILLSDQAPSDAEPNQTRGRWGLT